MNLGSWKIRKSPTAVPEYAAEGEIERVYHEIRQSLGVTGVNLVFRTWASFGEFLPVVWRQLRPNVETTVFEQAAREIRNQASGTASGLVQPVGQDLNDLGESRSYQIRAALELYHDINPKLLVLVCAVRQALQGAALASSADQNSGALPRGEPAKMYPMEMEDRKPDDRFLRRLFKDIQKTLSLASVNSDYRTLALWPDYLDHAWQRLKPLGVSREFNEAADKLRQRAATLASQLPHPVALSLGRVKELGEDPDQVLETTRQFERLLPGLILNISILYQERPQPSTKQNGPRPAVAPVSTATEEPAWRGCQKRQRVLELNTEFVSYLDEGDGEPAVLLHGIPTWGFLWERTIAALSPRYRLIVPDLLGYGYSSKRDSFDRSIAAQTEMVDALLAKLNVNSAHVVGHDLGGGVALRLATLFPHRVRSLTVMNSVCYDAWPVEMMLQLGHPNAARKLPPKSMLQLLKKSLLAGFRYPPDSAWLDGLLSPWRTEVGRLSLVRNAAGLNTSQTTEISRLLPGIKVPTLVIWGEDDPFLPVRFGQRLADDIPGANLVRVAEARHFVMMDQPDRVDATLRTFLGRLATPDTRAAA